jgi:hypothetical protein
VELASIGARPDLRFFKSFQGLVRLVYSISLYRQSGVRANNFGSLGFVFKKTFNERGGQIYAICQDVDVSEFGAKRIQGMPTS